MITTTANLHVSQQAGDDDPLWQRHRRGRLCRGQ